MNRVWLQTLKDSLKSFTDSVENVTTIAWGRVGCLEGDAGVLTVLTSGGAACLPPELPRCLHLFYPSIPMKQWSTIAVQKSHHSKMMTSSCLIYWEEKIILPHCILRMTFSLFWSPYTWVWEDFEHAQLKRALLWMLLAMDGLCLSSNQNDCQ